VREPDQKLAADFGKLCARVANVFSCSLLLKEPFIPKADILLAIHCLEFLDEFSGTARYIDLPSNRRFYC
jgi:hypothetical protein